VLRCGRALPQRKCTTVPASKHTANVVVCCILQLSVAGELSSSAKPQNAAVSERHEQKRTCLPCSSLLLKLLPLGWGIAPRKQKIGKELFVNFFVRVKKTKAPETSVAERLGVWASACTSDCRNTVDTSGVSPATAGRWHSSRVRPQCPDPGQLERETQVQGPMGNLHLRGHSLWPGTWEGREGCFCNIEEEDGSHEEQEEATGKWSMIKNSNGITSKEWFTVSVGNVFFVTWALGLLWAAELTLQRQQQR
jgi:hypothetical protein